jgi:hypothetical protein
MPVSSLRRDDFLAHYHKRSNVESPFSMIKAEFRDNGRSGTAVAMVNEVLCKIICPIASYPLGAGGNVARPRYSPQHQKLSSADAPVCVR